MRRRALLLAAALCTAPMLGAQQVDVAQRAFAVRLRSEVADSVDHGITAGLHRAVEKLPLWSAPIASAILPGLGQFRLHRDRFVAFAAAEAFLFVQYTKNNNEGAGSARNYRALARDVSRRTFPGTHPDTIFEYYEAMSKNAESGSFSLTPLGPTTPETNPATFNGKQWILAREQFGVPLDDDLARQSPRYAEAVAYYESRAIAQAYGWTWRDAKLEQDLFGREIARSNDAYVRARRNLSALIANHLLSTIDAFASVRLIQAAGGEMQLTASFPIR